MTKELFLWFLPLAQVGGVEPGAGVRRRPGPQLVQIGRRRREEFREAEREREADGAFRRHDREGRDAAKGRVQGVGGARAIPRLGAPGNTRVSLS